jgi:hypothetical protein
VTLKTAWLETKMIPGFEKTVEERILAAQKQGAFDDLPHSGKPLAHDDRRHVSEELRLGYKILKNADCLPPEIELKKQIVHIESLLDGMEDTREAYRLMKKLNFLILKLNSFRQGPIAFEMQQHYNEKLVRRFGENQTRP